MITLLKIFLSYFKVGLTTIGGGYAMLPILQGELCARRGWLSPEKVSNLYSVAQCEPGPIAINVSVLSGATLRGKRGDGILAAFAVCVPSVIIILLIAVLLENFQDIPVVSHALAGIKVAVAALVVQITWKMLRRGVKDLMGALIFAASLILLLLNLVNAVLIILGAAAVGVLFCALRRRKKAMP